METTQTFHKVVEECIRAEFIKRHPDFELMEFQGVSNPPRTTTCLTVPVGAGKGTYGHETAYVPVTQYKYVTLTVNLSKVQVSTLDAFLKYLYTIIKRQDPGDTAETKEILAYSATLKTVGAEKPLRRFMNTNGIDDRVKMILTRAKKVKKDYIMTVTIAIYL